MSDVDFASSEGAAKERAVPAQIWHRSAMRSELPTLIGGIGLDALGPGSDSSPSRVMGREAEMHLLSQALERTRIGGEPGSITLLGPKNAGKTRLLEAFVEGAWAKQYGFDLVNLGVVMTLLIMIGNLTPPVGMCLFAVASFSRVGLWALAKECLPYIIGIFLVTLLIAYVPAIATWLPNLVMGPGM